MDARTGTEPLFEPLGESDGESDDAEVVVAERHPRPAISLDGLSLAGLTRRRVAWLIGVLVTAWIVVVFARQVAEASSKTAEADRARLSNAALVSDVSSLQRELAVVKRQAFITQQAHGLGLGGARDHAFVLAPDAGPLAANAPGSAAVRLGARPASVSPLESWLSLLFGPVPTN
jgi:hypothetical protein